MKKNIVALLLISLAVASCNKDPQPLSKKEIQQKIDSITTSRIKEMDERSKKDLEVRITIEVKVKADSILNARLQHTLKDTSSKRALRKNSINPGI